MMAIQVLLLVILGFQEPSSFEEVRDYILPTTEELTWTKIPWRGTFWETVVEAQGKDRPILLWAMNGHPFAQT